MDTLREAEARVELLRRREAAEQALEAAGVDRSVLNPGFVRYWVKQGKTAEEIVKIANGTKYTFVRDGGVER